jgi:hypothetical protein
VQVDHVLDLVVAALVALAEVDQVPVAHVVLLAQHLGVGLERRQALEAELRDEARTAEATTQAVSKHIIMLRVTAWALTYLGKEAGTSQSEKKS